MKRPILIILIVIGFCVITVPILAILYILMAKPFGIELQNVPGVIFQTQDGAADSAYDHPLLTTEQESALENLGVDTSALPTSITAEQTACFTEALGAERVQELLNGAALSITDVYRANACIK